MLSIKRQQRISRIRELIDLLEAKKDLYFNKYLRAKTDSKQDYWYNKYKILRKVISQYWQNNYWVFEGQFMSSGVLRAWRISDHKRTESERIKLGKEKFETMHFYSTWFFGTSLTDDYGTYACDRCGRTFYHSPSKITLAAKTVYECCCGHCTNEIISRDHQSTPYS